MFALEKQTRLVRKQTRFILTLPVAGAVHLPHLAQPQLAPVLILVSQTLWYRLYYNVYTLLAGNFKQKLQVIYNFRCSIPCPEIKGHAIETGRMTCKIIL